MVSGSIVRDVVRNIRREGIVWWDNCDRLVGV